MFKSVSTCDAGDVAVVADLDSRVVLYAIDEVAGHAPGEVVTAHDHEYMVVLGRQGESCFACGVGAADHDRGFACLQVRFECAGAVHDSGSFELFEARHA